MTITKTIKNTTRNQTQYELVQWKVLNEQGDIEGAGTKILPPAGYLPRQRSSFEGTVQCASIVKLEIVESRSTSFPDYFIDGAALVVIVVFIFGGLLSPWSSNP